MKILLVCLIVLLLLAVYPVRAAAELSGWRIKVYWLPVFGLPWRVKLLEKDLTPPDDPVASLVQGDIIGWDRLKQRQAAEKPKPEPKHKPHFQADWRKLAAGVLAALHIRRFRLFARLGGDPAATALLAGAGWSALSVALGWLSFNAAAWPKDAQVDINLLPPPAGIRDSQIDFTAEGWLTAGAVLPRMASALGGGRKKRRLAAGTR